MNWYLSTREKISLILGSMVLIAWAFWNFVYAPMQAHSTLLQRGLNQSQSIAAELNAMVSEISAFSRHQKVSSKDAEKLIRQRFQSKITAFKAESNQRFTIQLAVMPLPSLLQNLLILKNQHGLAVTYAKLTKNDNKVSAKLTIKHP